MKTVKKSTTSKIPAWFLAFEKRINARFDKIENDISKLNKKVDTIIKLNHLKTK